jgi:GPH family glycoside/pentoside/hexuronide:cation symporter
MKPSPSSTTGTKPDLSGSKGPPSDPLAPTASTRGLHGVGLGALSEWTVSSTVGYLLMPIYTTAFQMNPVLVGWAVSLPRLLDAIIDPAIGNWSDRTRTRWGRRKPFLLAGALMCALFSAAVWWTSPHWSEKLQFAYLLATSIGLWVGFAIYTIPSNALGYELSLDYNDRTRVMAVRALYCTLPGLVFGWTYWLVLRPGFGGEIPGVRIVSACVAVVILATGLAPIWLIQERFADRAAPKQPLWTAVREAIANRHFRCLVGLGLVAMLGNSIYGGLQIYVNIYQVCGGDKTLATKIAGATTMLATGFAFIFIPLLPGIGRKVGKKRGICLGAAGFLLHALLQPLLHNPSVPWLQLVNVILIAPANATFGTFIGASIPDICDLDELATGKRREATFGAVFLFLRKIEVSLTALLTGALLSLAGFEGGKTQQSLETLAKLRLFAFGPYIVCSAVLLMLAWRFPITKELIVEARRLLDRQAKGAAAAAG